MISVIPHTGVLWLAGSHGPPYSSVAAPSRENQAKPASYKTHPTERGNGAQPSCSCKGKQIEAGRKEQRPGHKEPASGNWQTAA